MKQKLISTLQTFGFPVHLQGTMNAEEQYPETFITFWCNDTDDTLHLDNEVVAVDWLFNVTLYSSNAAIVNTKPKEIISALKNAEFIAQGKGHDIPSDEPTHTGWTIDFIISEKQ